MRKCVNLSVLCLTLASRLLITAFGFSVCAFAQTSDQPPPEGFPLGPPVKILGFSADSSSVQPGHSVTLKWAVVNADRIIIEPDVGVVAARGSHAVMPPATTAYTLTAIGRGGADKRSLTVTVEGTVPAATANTGTESNPLSNLPIPRKPDGKPDLSGVYIAGFDLHPAGPVTLKPGAEKYNVGREYGFSLGEHCLPPGLPDAVGQPYPVQFVQTANLLVLLYEAHHLSRAIPTDGQPHPTDLDPTWMGNSVGHWEGDTLVVDVIGFNDKTAVGEYRHTTAYHVVERYRRTAYDQISYEATIEDPNVFARPWKEIATFRLHPEWQIQEYVCEENNHDYKALFEKYRGHE
jgi:hypothetical protein